MNETIDSMKPLSCQLRKIRPKTALISKVAYDSNLETLGEEGQLIEQRDTIDRMRRNS